MNPVVLGTGSAMIEGVKETCPWADQDADL
jgi:hypothetical protein